MTPRPTSTLSALAIALAMLPSVSQAQTQQSPASQAPKSGVSFSAGTLAAALPTQATQKNSGTSRRTKMIIGAVAGGVGGCLLGELILGQQLDFPHGPDMLIGAGIGAALGTWAGSAAHRNSVSTAAPAPKKKGLSVIPVVSSKTKAVIVSFPLK